MEQIERIQKMEAALDEAVSVKKEFDRAFEELKNCKDNIVKLFEYYGSLDWSEDLENWEAGKLPEDLKCGVLSEDAVYDLITDTRETAFEMIETATDLLKAI